MRRILLLAVLLACACTPKPSPETVAGTPVAIASEAPAGSDPAFCKVLAEFLAAADGDFASLRTGDPEKMMRTWQSTASLPGSSTCRVADKDPTSFGSVFCVLTESGDAATLEREYATAVAKTKQCLADWKLDTGEQLGTKWSELLPPTQPSGARALQVHVRLTEAKEVAKGSVTIDVSVKRPGNRPAVEPASN